MPAMVRDGEFFDPDDVKVPQSFDHDRAVALLRLAATRLLGPDVDVIHDMNWYPPDGGTAVAPDIMVLPAGVVVATPRSRTKTGRPKSYRQDDLGGPPPLVAIEIASATDTFDELRLKLERYRRLGSVGYLLTTLTTHPALYRLGPKDRSLVEWTGRPIPELGGARIDMIDGQPMVTIAEGVSGDSHQSLLDSILAADRAQAEAKQEQAEADRAQAEAKQEQAEADRAQAEAKREQAEADRAQAEAKQEQAEADRARAEAKRERVEDRAEALARQLEALGITPDA